MKGGTAKLVLATLSLFRLACRRNWLDVAEHLLGALESLNRRSDNCEQPHDPKVLLKAYSELARRA